MPHRAPGPLALSEPAYVAEILQAAGFVGFALVTEHPVLVGHATAEEEPASPPSAGRWPGS